jgi:hypothetical protein
MLLEQRRRASTRWPRDAAGSRSRDIRRLGSVHAVLEVQDDLALRDGAGVGEAEQHGADLIGGVGLALIRLGEAVMTQPRPNPMSRLLTQELRPPATAARRARSRDERRNSVALSE